MDDRSLRRLLPRRQTCVLWDAEFQAEAEAVAAEIAHSGGLTEVTMSASERQGRVQVTVSGQTQVFFDVGQSRIVEHAVLVEERVTSP